MENHFLDAAALKALIYRLSTSSDPDARDDLKIVNTALESFHNYVDAVFRGEKDLLIQGSSLEGQAYRDAILSYDESRHGAHETAIFNVKLLNRLATQQYNLQPIFTGNDYQRHQVADFCLELDQYLFINRRMKLS